MNLRHRFPNLSVLGSLSLLGIVTQQNATRTETEIPKTFPLEKALTTDTDLLAKTVETPFEKNKHSKVFIQEEVTLCGFSDTNALCLKKAVDDLDFTELALSKKQEENTVETNSQSLAHLIEKSKDLIIGHPEWKTPHNNRVSENISVPYSLPSYETPHSKQTFSPRLSTGKEVPVKSSMGAEVKQSRRQVSKPSTTSRQIPKSPNPQSVNQVSLGASYQLSGPYSLRSYNAA
ncbi:hypothetical protein NUACC21_10720 [Scytonema sp. NUACC21]